MKDEEVEDDLSERGRKLAVSIFQGAWREWGLRAFLSGSGRRQRSGKSGEAALRCLFARTDLGGSAGERATGWVLVHVTWGKKAALRLCCNLEERKERMESYRKIGCQKHGNMAFLASSLFPLCESDGDDFGTAGSTQCWSSKAAQAQAQENNICFLAIS